MDHKNVEQAEEAFHSVKTYAAANPAFTEASLRWLVFCYKDLLLEEGAISFVGKKLIISDKEFPRVIKEGRLAA